MSDFPEPVSRRSALVGGAAAAIACCPPLTLSASSSSTLLVTHPCFAMHNPGPFNVERPARMKAIDVALSDPRFLKLVRDEAPLRDDVEEAILRAHGVEYFRRLRSIGENKDELPFSFDGDTAMSVGSWEAILRGVGAGLFAVDTVLDQASGVKNAFCQIRPPGHHAEAARAMGFCFFSNVAIAAFYALAKHSIARVAVVDFDVHHGNGTQHQFWTNPNLFYGSTHEMPLFPGTGAITETGVGNIFNVPLKAGDDGVRFREAMATRVLPALDAFRPDLILISAGFDAHVGDPLAHIRLVEDDFIWVTQKIMDLADKHCRGRVVSMLEGGYSLEALARSTAAHVQTLMTA